MAEKADVIGRLDNTVEALESAMVMLAAHNKYLWRTDDGWVFTDEYRADRTMRCGHPGSPSSPTVKEAAEAAINKMVDDYSLESLDRRREADQFRSAAKKLGPLVGR